MASGPLDKDCTLATNGRTGVIHLTFGLSLEGGQTGRCTRLWGAGRVRPDPNDTPRNEFARFKLLSGDSMSTPPSNGAHLAWRTKRWRRLPQRLAHERTMPAATCMSDKYATTWSDTDQVRSTRGCVNLGDVGGGRQADAAITCFHACVALGLLLQCPSRHIHHLSTQERHPKDGEDDDCYKAHYDEGSFMVVMRIGRIRVRSTSVPSDAGGGTGSRR